MISTRDLELEIEKLKEQEERIDSQLRQYFSSLSSGQSLRQKSTTIETSDLRSQCQKIEKFAPCFEAMSEDAKKLSIQVDDCRTLSDRISLIVRKLDVKQMRAQQALACAEDIINLKDCKVKLLAAIEEGNLPLAVSFVRQVHDIDLQAASASDDFGAIQEAESNLRDLVRDEFNKAITQSDTNRVMSLCPLLQTLGLESVARDSFLEYVEQSVFASVSADAPVDGATDPATAYAQALSNIFNSTYSIFQQFLPMIIQGMESSLGDVHFIRRMHQKCEREAAIVFKRYMKYRNLKEVISGLKSPTAKHLSPAEMHVVLDEVALLLQYCCLYSKYLHQLCVGAESRVRKPAVVPSSGTAGGVTTGTTATISAFTVFPVGGTQFDRMVDEVINQYYMEGEQWLMYQGMKITSTRGGDGVPCIREDVGLDECFFVLRRCGQRAIATNNVQVACAVINVISNLLSSNLLVQLSDLMGAAVAKVVLTVQDQLSRFLKQQSASAVTGVYSASGSGGDGFSLGIKSAMSMASSLTVSKSSTTKSGTTTAPDDSDKAAGTDEDDPYQLGHVFQSFNMIEVCIRYTDRLAREVQQTGSVVFAPMTSSTASGATATATAAVVTNASKTPIITSDIDKIRMSIETIEGSKLLFQQVREFLYY